MVVPESPFAQSDVHPIVSRALGCSYRNWKLNIHEHRRQVAKLIGLKDATAVVSKTSAGQGLRAVLNALPKDGSTRPVRVLTTCSEFDSLDFILKTYATIMVTAVLLC